MPSSILVFDASPDDTALLFDEEGTTTISDAAPSSAVVFDDSTSHVVGGQGEVPVGTLVLDGVPTDVLIADPQQSTVVVSPAELPDVVIVDDQGQELLVVGPEGPPIPGPQGNEGGRGPQGPEGVPGVGAYYQEFGFASPSTTWVIAHNTNRYGLNVEVVDTNGEPIEGLVRFIDSNTIEIDWYYPTSGTARIFR